MTLLPLWILIVSLASAGGIVGLVFVLTTQSARIRALEQRVDCLTAFVAEQDKRGGGRVA
jgi:hypothetical protein